ncbi:hypothetical protein [Acrocarpospora catenulata]|uniref:hypothetical protein n=1 Tax=Acrocarpospora catenulata TaxID=2836182 RepID=UPI001BDA227B|nr:hypothetical protein [Acrocarpospora catenulata]
MIKSMDEDATTLRTFVQRFRGEFARLGVDTSALTELDQIGAWAQGQLPAMRRRHDLAMATNRLGGAGFGDALVPIPEVRMSLAEAYAYGEGLAKMFGAGIIANNDFTAELKGEMVHAHIRDLENLAGDAEASAAFVAMLAAGLAGRGNGGKPCVRHAGRCGRAGVAGDRR